VIAHRAGVALLLLLAGCASPRQPGPAPGTADTVPRAVTAAEPAAGTARPADAKASNRTAASPSASSTTTAAPAKKLIEMGWDEPSTQFMRAHITQMEEAPFDGCVFHVLYASPDGKSGNFTWEMWGRRAFTIKELQPALDDLQATRFRRFTDNFLRINVTPGDMDWFDDPATIVGNVRLAARIARQGGCAGLFFDVEPYRQPVWDPSRTGRPWKESAPRLRQWGRLVMGAIQEEYPDINILFGWSYSFPWHEVTLRDKTIERCPHGLIAPFLDGMFDVASGGTRLMDGHELSYGYRDTSLFRKARATIREGVLPIVANPDRYRRYSEVAFGLWMDNDSQRKGWDSLSVDRNHFNPAALERSLTQALRLSDRYAWLYSEQPRWWTAERRRRAMPAPYVEAVRRARRAAGLPAY